MVALFFLAAVAAGEPDPPAQRATVPAIHLSGGLGVAGGQGIELPASLSLGISMSILRRAGELPFMGGIDIGYQSYNVMRFAKCSPELCDQAYAVRASGAINFALSKMFFLRALLGPEFFFHRTEDPAKAATLDERVMQAGFGFSLGLGGGVRLAPAAKFGVNLGLTATLDLALAPEVAAGLQAAGTLSLEWR